MTLLVPAGTAIPVHVVGTLSSGSSKSADAFQIQVAADVVLNDRLSSERAREARAISSSRIRRAAMAIQARSPWRSIMFTLPTVVE
jgi:hypothetical protein